MCVAVIRPTQRALRRDQRQLGDPPDLQHGLPPLSRRRLG
jgi:hypothetical protein